MWLESPFITGSLADRPMGPAPTRTSRPQSIVARPSKAAAEVIWASSLIETIFLGGCHV